MLRWSFLLLSIACFACSLATKSMVSLILLWLLAFALFVLWAIAQYQAHAGSNHAPKIGPAEIKRLREQAEARKAAQPHDAPDKNTPQS